MGKVGAALALAASLAGSGCVQSRQYADVQFTPPQGDYRLLVMRPDVAVNALETGGMPQPRADWTEQARSNIIEALRADQAGRGGKVLVIAKRNELPNVSADEIADLERLHYAVGNSIALHKYSGAALPTKRGKGLEYTLGEDAVSLGRRTGYDYALFLYAEDNIASSGRTALQVLGSRDVSSASALLAAGAISSLMHRLSTSGPAKSCGSTSCRPAASSQASRSATFGHSKAQARWSSGCSDG
ncbi:hypothetical protein H9L15_10060 [Sphingomonas daechungensis]|uniref:Uncharacterized protein n=1 Tax=Sphingomonas daechungensis TaxID=1176646 RepID=A0ABX6T4I6_9SPHN|nr:hypothetical protein [Sphingomonas daechungensis]QNP42558.1 hypothetical protein H9L15_10060 [Sphingomonas daechungensis]